ncbi:MAG: biopolymer transporter ExbD [Salinivirgaceae bacterium]|nr:biopolymer transporter ExbD [Salinivirgaceae bacterium]
MAEMNVQSKDHGKGGKPKPKKVSTRVDLTPMVDLGFLLITFFMLTTTLIKPQTMEIYLPSNKKEDEDKQTEIKQSQAITILINNENKLYYFFGGPEGEKDPELIVTDYSPTGLRSMLLQRNAEVVLKIEELKKKLESRELTQEQFSEQSAAVKRELHIAPVVVIKATDLASYKNLVDVLDEMQICNVARYAIVDITDYDKELIAKIEGTGISEPGGTN